MDFISCLNCSSKNYTLLTKSTNVGTSGKKSLTIDICKDCGFVFLNPQPTSEMYARYYSTYGRKNKSTKTLVDEKVDQRGYIDLIKDHVTTSSRILDIGCGKAIFLSFLKEKGYKNLFGIELSRDEIEFAKREFDLDITYAAIEDYKEKDFDLAVLIAMIEHYKDPRKSMEAVRSVLKDGGLVFISTPNVKKMVLRKGVSNYFKFVHTNYFSMTTLKSVVQQAGFEILEAMETKPVLSKSFLHPRSYKDSDLLLLARKIDKPGPVLREDFRDIVSIFKQAKNRDALSALVYKIDQIRGLGFLFKIVRRVVE